MRTRILPVLIALALPPTADSLNAQDALRTGPKVRIAVMEPYWDPGVLQSNWAYGGNAPSIYASQQQTFARGLNEMMIAELLETGRFIVLERKELEDILAEQDLQFSGAVNPETASNAGRLLGAQFLIRPTITEYSYAQEGDQKGGSLTLPSSVPVAGGFQIGGGGTKIVASLTIDARIYEVETGQITSSVKGEAEADRKMKTWSLDTQYFDYQSTDFENTPLGEATREAVTQVVAAIVADLGDRPWEGRVVMVQGGQVYVNSGEAGGLRVGDVLTVFRPGEELVDPATGLKLGQVEERLGQLKITSVQEKYSIASPLGGFLCERNDLLRFGTH